MRNTFQEQVERIVLNSVELAPGDKAILSLQLPTAFLIIFDPAPGPIRLTLEDRTAVVAEHLKSSTELYERGGDLVAHDLVQAHFRVLNEIAAAEAGSGQDNWRCRDGEVPDTRSGGRRSHADAPGDARS